MQIFYLPQNLTRNFIVLENISEKNIHCMGLNSLEYSGRFVAWQLLTIRELFFFKVVWVRLKTRIEHTINKNVRRLNTALPIT